MLFEWFILKWCFKNYSTIFVLFNIFIIVIRLCVAINDSLWCFKELWLYVISWKSLPPIIISWTLIVIGYYFIFIWFKKSGFILFFGSFSFWDVPVVSVLLFPVALVWLVNTTNIFTHGGYLILLCCVFNLWGLMRSFLWFWSKLEYIFCIHPFLKDIHAYSIQIHGIIRSEKLKIGFWNIPKAYPQKVTQFRPRVFN